MTIGNKFYNDFQRQMEQLEHHFRGSIKAKKINFVDKIERKLGHMELMNVNTEFQSKLVKKTFSIGRLKLWQALYQYPYLL